MRLRSRDRATRRTVTALCMALALALACSEGADAGNQAGTPAGKAAGDAANAAAGADQGKNETAARAEAPKGHEEKPNVTDSALSAIDEFIAAQKVDKSSSSWKTKLAKPPELTFDADRTYVWVLETNAGAMKLEFLPDDAPMHVSSAIYLTRLGFFDGLTFHRVIPGFMAQGGDPLGNGRGSPGYKFDGEFGGSARHDKPGILSQANAGPGTDGSQFFITFVKTPHLDGKHTIYGRLVEGTETLEEIEKRRQPNSPKLREPLLIERATIEVN